mmetsp:Transcript_35750/g.83191  ORF Transcript_35750/g.83191 Transcript_35750/m.83191 type:complete len:216 (-) Transcript_35750:122-769(-)
MHRIAMDAMSKKHGVTQHAQIIPNHQSFQMSISTFFICGIIILARRHLSKRRRRTDTALTVERPQRTGSTTSFGNQAMSSRDQNGRDPRRRSVVDFRRGNAAPARRTMRRRDRLSARAAKADERRENVRDAPCNRLNFERRAPSFFHSDPGLKTIGVTWGRCRHCGVDEGKQRHSPPPGGGLGGNCDDASPSSPNLPADIAKWSDSIMRAAIKIR